MYVGNETEIFMTTGCLSSCDKYDYTLSPLTNIKTIKSQAIGKNYITLRFIITTGRHEEKEQVQMEKEIYLMGMEFMILSNDVNLFQYIIYDWNSLLADMGGYLGLLLGQSIFGIYQLVKTLINHDKFLQYKCKGL